MGPEWDLPSDLTVADHRFINRWYRYQINTGTRIPHYQYEYTEEHAEWRKWNTCDNPCPECRKL